MENFKDCFINDSTCGERIVRAHILSKSATISLIKGKTLGGDKVVHLGSPWELGKKKPALIGWKKASTHHCFCDKHDNDLFEEIENGNRIDLNNSRQLFAICLRSFAYSYYRAKGFLNRDNSKIDTKDGVWKELTRMIQASRGQYKPESKILDFDFWAFETVRQKLLDLLARNQFDGLIYARFKISMRFPIASAGVLMAIIADPNRLIPTMISRNGETPLITPPAIILTILPDNEGGTMIVFGILKSDYNAKMVLEKILRLPPRELRRAISSIIIGTSNENTFFNPVLWEFIQAEGGEERMIEEINDKSRLDLISLKPYPVQQSSFDLFDPKYACKSLGI
jgi:hypothetical protein